MKVSSGWSAVGAFFGVLIILDLLTHPTGTTAVAKGLTGVIGTTGTALTKG